MSVASEKEIREIVTIKNKEILHLPRDVWVKIFNMMSLRTLGALECSCTYFRDTLIRDGYYNRYFSQIFESQTMYYKNNFTSKELLRVVGSNWTSHGFYNLLKQGTKKRRRLKDDFCEDHRSFVCADDIYACESCRKHTCRHVEDSYKCVDCVVYNICYVCHETRPIEKLYSCDLCNKNYMYCFLCAQHCQCGKKLCDSCCEKQTDKQKRCRSCLEIFEQLQKPLPCCQRIPYAMHVLKSMKPCIVCKVIKCPDCFLEKHNLLKHDDICTSCLKIATDELLKQ